MPWLLALTTLACGLMGGTFFAFSSFIMPALGRIPTEQGIHAMQRINIDVYHWTFMGAFLLTPVLCIATAVQAYRSGSPHAALFAIVGCLVYVVGNFVVTAGGNVPLNNALAEVDAATVDAARTWSSYLANWTRWNHVRTAASMIAAACYLAALGTG